MATERTKRVAWPERKIIWAVDPFCKKCALARQTARAVSALSLQWSAEVEPVYLLNDVPPNVGLLPVLIREIGAQAQAELKHLVKGVRFSFLREVRVIGGLGASMRDRADQLIEYAKAAGASLIAVGTRTRPAPKRWFVGSFAETLILRSDVPLYVVSPAETAADRIEHVLFPTDFSEESRQAFRRVVEFAAQVGAEVTVFHKVKYDLIPAVEVGFNAYPYYKDVLAQEVLSRRQQAEQWVKDAQAAGVSAEPIVDYRIGASVAQAILNRGETRGGIIAMAAHSGPIASALLGSTTRYVVRGATCPVWVVHTERRGRAMKPVDLSEQDLMSDLIDHGRGKKAA